MKILRILWVVLFVTIPLAVASGQESQASSNQSPSNPKLSPGVADVIKLANAGVSDEVIIAYVEKSHEEFALTTDDIIALNNSKVSARVITAILQHEGLLSSNQQEQPQSAPPPVTAVQAPPPAVVVQTPPPPVPYVEVVPVAPGPNYYWRPGHWYWNGGWVWMNGSWIYRRPWVVPFRPVPPRPFVVPDRDWRGR